MPSEPEGHCMFNLLSTAVSAADPTQTMDLQGTIFSVLLLILLIFLNGFFAASEIAVITLNDGKLKKMAEDGNKKAQKLVKLTANSSRFLSTIQIGVTLSGFLTSASASQSFANMLADWLSGFIPLSHSTIVGISTVLITIVLSYFSLVLGELVPKKIAMQRAEQLSFKFVGILSAVAKIFSPFITFLSFSTNLVLRLFGIDPNSSEETVTEEEILMMVDVGQEKGVIDPGAKDMISNIFEFDDRAVSEIMTHRTEVTAVEDTATVLEAARLATEEGYSRMPVYHDQLDTVLGIFYVKDLLRYVGQDIPEDAKITDYMRPAYFVPESKSCNELLEEMTARRLQIAIVVDEYGGTEGIVTMEDLLESIVGNIQDEYDDEEEEIFRVSENAFTVDGSTSIDEIEDLLDVDLPEGDYDTIAGMVVELLGRIPKPGEHPTVTWENLTFTVEEVEERRISKLLIVKDPEYQKEKEDKDEKED